MARCSASPAPAAFVVGADVLLADEPTSELDEGNRGLVLEELRAEAARGAVVVVATHDPAVVEACDRHYALDEGVLVEHVPPRARRAAERPTPAPAFAPPPVRVEAPAAPEPAAETAAEHEPPSRSRPSGPATPSRGPRTTRERCMSRATLGARARRGPLLTLAAMAAVVVAGTVTVLGFAAAAGTSPWLVLPLAVIGALAVPAAGHELAVARREEIGLARLRGVHGARLVVFMLAEPLTAILAGAVAGVALGVAGTWLATWRWLDAPEVALAGSTPAAVGAVVAVGLLGVFAGMASSRSEPLSDQVSIATRTRPASTAATFGSVLILVAAVIAVYRSGRGTDPDWVVLAGPALVGLAAGQLTVWLLRGGGPDRHGPDRRQRVAGLPGHPPGRSRPPTGAPRCASSSPPVRSPPWPRPVRSAWPAGPTQSGADHGGCSGAGRRRRAPPRRRWPPPRSTTPTAGG